MIIGITGSDGSGKGTVVDYLVKEKGFSHYHARTLLIEEIERRGLPVDRNHMRLVANELRAKHGNDYLVQFFLAKAEQEKDKNIIIDSLRAFEEAKTLKENNGLLLSVDAPVEIRYKRVQNRRSESDKVTYEEFVTHEELERNDPDPHGMQKAKVMEMADYTILNEGTLEELHENIENVLAQIEHGA